VSSILGEAAEAIADPARMVVGVIALGTLLAVLLMREVGRAQLSGERLGRAEALGFVTVPLTLVFAAVVVPRIVDLLS
jgi:hypothetical protein